MRRTMLCTVKLTIIIYMIIYELIDNAVLRYELCLFSRLLKNSTRQVPPTHHHTG